MNTFKVKNITDRLGKRHPNFNSTLNIGYVDQMERKNLLLEPKKTMFFTTTSLPLSLHRLRMKGLITITEVTEQELLKIKNEDSKREEEKETIKKEKKTTPKKTTKSKGSSTKSKSGSSKRTYSKRTTTTTTTKNMGEESE